MSRLLVLQHLARERPGLFAKVAKERGFTVCTFRLDLGDSLPDLRNGDLLLVLGGPMGINMPTRTCFLVAFHGADGGVGGGGA